MSNRNTEIVTELRRISEDLHCICDRLALVLPKEEPKGDSDGTGRHPYKYDWNRYWKLQGRKY